MAMIRETENVIADIDEAVRSFSFISSLPHIITTVVKKITEMCFRKICHTVMSRKKWGLSVVANRILSFLFFQSAPTVLNDSGSRLAISQFWCTLELQKRSRNFNVCPLIDSVYWMVGEEKSTGLSPIKSPIHFSAVREERDGYVWLVEENLRSSQRFIEGREQCRLQYVRQLDELEEWSLIWDMCRSGLERGEFMLQVMHSNFFLLHNIDDLYPILLNYSSFLCFLIVTE